MHIDVAATGKKGSELEDLWSLFPPSLPEFDFHCSLEFGFVMNILRPNLIMVHLSSLVLLLGNFSLFLFGKRNFLFFFFNGLLGFMVLHGLVSTSHFLSSHV